MPIYEPDLSYEDMKKAQHTFKCARCGGRLIVAWNGKKDSYMLRCTKALEHEGIVPLGRDPEVTEINARLRGGGYPMESKALKELGKQAMLARVEKAKFPKDLTKEEKSVVAIIALEYGLDPLFGELMLYQGKPYVTIDARRRCAQESGKLEGINSRPATEEERKQRDVPEGDYLFVCEAWRQGSSHPFQGWGKVTAKEIEARKKQAEAHRSDPYALPIVKDPAAMAEKRAEAQALRRGFHIPLPSAEDIVEGEFTEIAEEEEAPGAKSNPAKPLARPTAPGQVHLATPPQVRKIWADAGKKGYSEADIHNTIKLEWEVEHVAELTVSQASTLIDKIAKDEIIRAEGQLPLGD